MQLQLLPLSLSAFAGTWLSNQEYNLKKKKTQGGPKQCLQNHFATMQLACRAGVTV